MRDNLTTYRKSLYEKYRGEQRSSVVFGIIASFVLAVLVFLVVITNFVLIKVKVSGKSMMPTLKQDDIVLVNTYGTPSRGDVIIISGEKENGDWLIKRAIALSGDTVKIEGGYVYLKKSGETEFVKLDEPYLGQQGITFWDDERAKGYFIEEGQVFYLGDNRSVSRDSRDGTFGTCTKEQVVGTVSDIAIRLKGVNTFFDSISQKINNLF